MIENKKDEEDNKIIENESNESNLNFINNDLTNVKSNLTDIKEIRCPLCPKFAKIEVNNLKNEVISVCPDNHYMKLDILSFQKKSTDHPIEITKCSKCLPYQKAQIYCLECNKYFCKDCIIIHNQNYLCIGNNLYSNIQLKKDLPNKDNINNNSINENIELNNSCQKNMSLFNKPKNNNSNIIKSPHHIIQIKEKDNYCALHLGEKFNSLCLQCNKSFCEKCLEEIKQNYSNNTILLSCVKIGNFNHAIKKFNDILNNEKINEIGQNLEKEDEINDYIEENSNMVIRQILEKIENLRKLHIFKEQLYNLYLKNQENAYLSMTINQLENSFNLQIEQFNSNLKILKYLGVVNSKEIPLYENKNKQKDDIEYQNKLNIKRIEKKKRKEERKQKRQESKILKELKKKEEKIVKDKNKKFNEELSLIINNNNTNINYVIIKDLKNNPDYQKIELFFLKLQNDKSIENNLFSEINQILQKNKANIEFYENFFQILNESNVNNLNKDKNEYFSLFVVKSLSNLVIFTNIMNNIIENIKDNLLNKENGKYYLIFDKIIINGENIVYENNFMCAFLNKNKIFKNVNIWKNSIFNKIIYILNKLSNMDLDFINSQYFQNVNNSKIDNFTELNENNIELSGLNKYIEKYTELSKEQIELINKKYNLEILPEVTKTYLYHMSNYNYILENPKYLNEIILNDFKIENQNQINFYIKYYKLCQNSAKKEKPKNTYNIKERKTKNKIFLLKTNKIDIIRKKYPCKFDCEKSLVIIIKNISKYLTDEDNIKLILLNKKHTYFNKLIYKNILKNEKISIYKRLNIWKSYLKCNENSSKINYIELLSKLKLNKQEKAKKNQKIETEIKKDLKKLKIEDKESYEAILNILKVFSFNKIINYYNGLHLLTLFLFSLSHNEAEVFIIINNLFYFSGLKFIIENDFKKLEIYYYIIDRLIFLYLPRIHSHFKDHQIKIKKFIGPYLLNLFTNIYPYLPDNNVKFLLYVWDSYIFDGWNNIFEIILTIFKYLEKNILSLKGNELRNYLKFDLVKCEIFLDNKFEEFCELNKLFKLKKELIDILKEEISFEKDINSLGEKINSC